MGVRYAKRNIYANVRQEGVSTGIPTLVGVTGRAVSPIFDEYVDDEDTTTDATEAAELAREAQAIRAPAPERPAGAELDDTASGDDDDGSDPSLVAAGDVSGEPLDGYDKLNAKEVLAELKDASEATVKAVKAYEADHQERKTILEFNPKGS